MEKYNSIYDTMGHINEVRININKVTTKLAERAAIHDVSKIKAPEVDLFDKYTPLLKGVTYGSDLYTQYLKELKVALDHHYANNRHHPEHYENGIQGMSLIDIVEMLCDWLAATKRHADGDIMKSIEINQTRFGYSDDLAMIFKNTVKDLTDESN